MMNTIDMPQDSPTNDSGTTATDPSNIDSNEKTIPFLRRLTDMLMENENVISFTAGSRDKDGKAVRLGKVIVHDRIKVEKDVLPKYFNHSSFASLRRQLNYFKFVRLGKGRQKGAVYCNQEVIQLEDILRLRRRPTQGTATAGPEATATLAAMTVSDSSADENGPPKASIASKKRSRSVDKTATTSSKSARKSSSSTLVDMATVMASPKLVSPRSTPTGSPATSPATGGSRITLDLTLPPVESSAPAYHQFTSMDQEYASDEDVLDTAKILVNISAAATVAF